MIRISLLLIALMSPVFTIAQDPIFAPTTESSKLGLNASFAGMNSSFMNLGLNGMIVQNGTDISYTLNSTYDQYFRKLSGSIGGIVERDLLNSNNNVLRISGIYSYRYRVTRRFTIFPAVNLRYSYANTRLQSYYQRYNFDARDSSGINSISYQNNFNINASVLFAWKHYYLGYQAGNLLPTTYSSVKDTNLITPVRHTLIASFDMDVAFRWTLNPIIVSEIQQAAFLDKASRTKYFNGNNYLHAGLNLRSDNWSYGVAYRYYKDHSPSYHAQLGVKIQNLQLFYQIGLNFTDFSAGQIHQFNVAYGIPSKSKPVTFRTISCPSFGGPVRVGHRYSLARSRSRYKYSQTTKKSTPAKKPESSQMIADPEIEAGTLTAGEINDFAKWDLWNDIKQQDLAMYRSTWKLDPRDRVCVRVLDSVEYPVHNAKVSLYDPSGTAIWSAKTDNTGKAELWANVAVADSNRMGYLLVEKDGQTERLDEVRPFKAGINDVRLNVPCTISKSIDVAFVVDATGSMDDEIKYLKTELDDIIHKLMLNHAEMDIRLGSMFYRCAGNLYTTRTKDLTHEVDTIYSFIDRQNSGEGGIEAVEVALDESVNQLSWNEEADARLMFIVLDESPGSQDSIIAQLHQSIRSAASKGIRIIPLVASGTGYNTDKSLEYLMRSIALATNGTYAFLTDDSGVGNDHTEPSIDEYEVELMNDLIIRLIDQFITVPKCGRPVQITTPSDSSLLSVLVPTSYLDTIQLIAQDTTNTSAKRDTVVLKIKDEICSISFYPNPTRGKIMIDNVENIEAVYLTDQNGKILQRIPLHEGLTTVDLSNHPAGMYYLQYHGEKRRFQTRLVLLD